MLKRSVNFGLFAWIIWGMFFLTEKIFSQPRSPFYTPYVLMPAIVLIFFRRTISHPVGDVLVFILIILHFLIQMAIREGANIDLFGTVADFVRIFVPALELAIVVVILIASTIGRRTAKLIHKK